MTLAGRVVEVELGLPTVGAEEEFRHSGDGVRAADHRELRLHPGHLAVAGGPEENVGLAHRNQVGVFELGAGPGREFRQSPAQAVPTNQQLFGRVQEFSDFRPNRAMGPDETCVAESAFVRSGEAENVVHPVSDLLCASEHHDIEVRGPVDKSRGGRPGGLYLSGPDDVVVVGVL